MIYDLHSHTTASSGLLTPETLVPCGRDARVGTLAITDHDTTTAILRQEEEGLTLRAGADLIPALEISTVQENHEIHIVGLNIIAHPAMRDFLAQQAAASGAWSTHCGRLEKSHISRRVGRGRERRPMAARWRAAFAPFWWSAAKPRPHGGCFK